MGRLEGQVAIVVGASSGMGREAALAFAAEGAAVVATARRQGELDELSARIREAGGEALVRVADVAKRDEIDAVVGAAVERFGRVDTMVVTAGINTPDRKLTVLTREQWDRIIDTNLNGAFNCVQAILPQMREQHNGLIVLVSSVSGKWGDMSGVAYQASKHGMVGLAYGTQFEEKGNGIRVTVIYPGLTDTPLLNKRPVPPTPELREKMVKPEDIAQACVFVAALPPRSYVPELVIVASELQCVGAAAV